MENAKQNNKKFKPRRAGRKAEKKDISDKKKRGLSTKKTNIRANQAAPLNDLKRRIEREQARLHAPLTSRTYGVPPPLCVAIVGPPKVGKTTLLKSLVKHFTKRNLSEANGPITIRGGKSRYTLIECDNDLNTYCDIAKICDVALVCIDASIGFELETFEFINVLQSHGFTRVMGVLTHLDTFKETKKVKELKTKLKHRFWVEVVEGSKIFNLTGIRNDLYTPRDMLNLGRFLSIIKPRPLTWRTTHPGILVDRFEDMTNPEEIKATPKMNRRLYFYGYVRGTFLKQKMNVHIPGVGDFKIQDSMSLEDPLPLGTKEKKAIGDKYRGIYAPMSNMGDLFYDKDSIYLNIKTNSKIDPEEQNMMEELKQGNRELDTKMQSQVLNIFKSSKPETRFADFDKMVQYEAEQKEEIEYDDEEGEEGEDIDEMDISEGQKSNQWKMKIQETTETKFTPQTDSLYEIVYGKQDVKNKDEEDLTRIPNFDLDDWNNENIRESIRNKFVTGDWKKRRDHQDPMQEDIIEPEEPIPEDIDDDIPTIGDPDDDLEDYKAKRKEKKEEFDVGYDQGEEEEEEMPKVVSEKPLSVAELLKSRKEEDPQAILNRKAFQGMDKATRELIEGYAPGTYVRMEISNIPAQFMESVDLKKPILVGGLHPEETRLGLINIRIKKHRWFPKILKNRDPLIFSMGWRRFQSVPIYTMQDPNLRYRMIKYTPQHMHCIATIYGPMVAQNTGFIAIQSLATVPTFRIAANGYVMEMDQNVQIVKKLKLIGYPKEIHQNTVFVTSMFNSALEVAKFEGAQLKTVSGLRGQVKKAVGGGKDGDFRATFEDKILMSDIIFLRSWVPVTPIKFYNPVLNQLGNWIPMRTTKQIRQVKGIEFKVSESSEYKPIERRSKVGHRIEARVASKLKKSLPFKDQEKQYVETLGVTEKLFEEDAPITKLTEAVMDDREKERYNILTKMKAIEADRLKKETMKLNKNKILETKKKLRQEKEQKSKMKQGIKRRYILQAEKRIKKAKYSTD